jgi:hypothetical protein
MVVTPLPTVHRRPEAQQPALRPQIHGKLEVRDNAAITFTGGDYVVCDFLFGKQTETLADGPTRINVSGAVQISNDSNFGPAAGQSCGLIRVNVKGPGDITFGRQIAANGYFCAPERTLQLGHDNDLTGRFFADTVSADSNNRAFCCLQDDGHGTPCACLDSFAPKVAQVGDTITMFSTCSLDVATQVQICGISAPITGQTATKIEATVPPGAAGACQVKLISPAGTCTAAATLTVS